MKSIVESHFDVIAEDYGRYKSRQKYYYSNLKKLVSQFIPKESEVFEVGCGTGHMLHSISPKNGFGFDISGEMINIATKTYSKNRNLHFSTKWPAKKFDYIFMCDVIEHLEEPNKTFKQISDSMTRQSLFICTMANPLLEPILMIAEKIGYKMPEGKHNRRSFPQIKNILKRNGLKVEKHDFKLLIPIQIPVITYLANKYLERYFKKYAFIEYFTATKT